ncbi:hypothetical protein MRX96_005772 [Rhipicephalus microplus]
MMYFASFIASTVVDGRTMVGERILRKYEYGKMFACAPEWRKDSPSMKQCRSAFSRFYGPSLGVDVSRESGSAEHQPSV